MNLGDEIIKLYRDDGKTLAEVAEIVGKPRTYVRDLLIRRGIPIRSKGRRARTTE